MVTTTLLEVDGAMNACVSGNADIVATATAADRIGGRKDLMDDVNFCSIYLLTRFKLLRIGEPPDKSDPCPLDTWVYMPYLYPNYRPPAPAPPAQKQNCNSSVFIQSQLSISFKLVSRPLLWY